MKKNIKLFILAIGFMILFGVENAFADYKIKIVYSGCNNIEDGKTLQEFKKGENINTLKCLDDGFEGWSVYLVSNRSSAYSNTTDTTSFCINGPLKESTIAIPECVQGIKLFSNGFNTSELISQVDLNTSTRVHTFYLTSSTYPTFTVKFDSAITEGVTGSMDGFDVKIGVSTKLPANQYKREGYTFDGWEAQFTGGLLMCNDGNIDHRNECGKSHGGVKKYPDGATISQTGTPGSTVTFIATWKSDSSGSSTVDKKCSEINDSQECVNNKCSWNKDYNFCSKDGLAYLSCGDANDIPAMVPDLISKGVTILKTITPIVLIIMAIIQLVKAIMGSKEEDIKKAQASLFKKAIAAALVFFVITIVQFIMLKAADSSEKNSLSDCLSCFLNGTSDEKCNSIYYKDGEDTIKVSK